MRISICECCGRKALIHHGNPKAAILCSRCSLYTKGLRYKISGLKRTIKNLNFKLYGIHKGEMKIVPKAFRYERKK